MNKLIRKLRDHFFRDIINRTNDLETALRVLVDSPAYRHDDVAGFNGQSGRKRIFRELLGKFDFHCFIETGTYLGDTAGYMAKTSGLPVFSCEVNPTLFSLAKLRLKDVPSVSLYNSDSREFLDGLSRKPEITRNGCFVYLDAHWGKSLPLKEEISIVASRWGKFIVMIDDFQVPGDDGYRYDRYGTVKYIGLPSLCSKYDLRVFFPSLPSREEPAGATGCVMLAKKDEFANPLNEISFIKEHRF